MKENELEYIKLYKDTLERSDLTGDEKVLLAIITSFNNTSTGLYMNTKTIAKMMGRSQRQVQRYLKTLFDKKLIMYMRHSINSCKRYIFLYDTEIVWHFERGDYPLKFVYDYKK